MNFLISLSQLLLYVVVGILTCTAVMLLGGIIYMILEKFDGKRMRTIKRLLVRVFYYTMLIIAVMSLGRVVVNC